MEVRSRIEGYLYFAAARWPTVKTYEYVIRAEVQEQYLPAATIPVHHMEAAEPDKELLKLELETADLRPCKGQIGEPTTVEKMDRCSCVEEEKDPGRNSVTSNVRFWHTGENWSQEHR